MSNLHRFLTCFDQSLRDLVWALTSPTMVVAKQLVNDDLGGNLLTNDVCHWLVDLSHEPAPLHAFLAEHTTNRLGIYFELLWAFFFSHAPGFELLAYNLAVRGDGRTLGAFDFIWRHQGHIYHWETAIKYYLQTEPALGFAGFIGPNKNDSLANKLQHCLEHQLPLLQSAEGQAALVDYGTPQSSALLLKGYLFYPWGNLLQPHGDLNPKHLHGHWLSADKLSVLLEKATSRWMVLPRLHWLSLAAAEDESQLLSGQQLQDYCHEYFSNHTSPFLIAECEAVDYGWQECRRLFITPNDW